MEKEIELGHSGSGSEPHNQCVTLYGSVLLMGNQHTLWLAPSGSRGTETGYHWNLSLPSSCHGNSLPSLLNLSATPKPAI